MTQSRADIGRDGGMRGAAGHSVQSAAGSSNCSANQA